MPRNDPAPRARAARAHATPKAATAMLLALLLGGAALAGCNTFEGAGEDIEDSGQALQDAAD